MIVGSVGSVAATFGGRRGGVCVTLLVLLIAVIGFGLVSAAKAAGEHESKANEPAPLDTQAFELAAEGRSGAANVAPPATDAEAAEELPHTDLDRGEAVELMNSVFAAELEGSAGILDDLHPERFDTDYGAVVPVDDLPGISEGPDGGDGSGSVLLASTVPLRREDEEGKTAPVDLGIEKSEGELQPANPLVEVGIPEELGEGISMPEYHLGMELLGMAEERAPSVVDGSVAIYPNVRPDTDLAIAPTPLGVETSTELRSTEAPTIERFRLSIPAGDSVATEGGGAIVRSPEGEPLVAVLPPTAIDANGASVPVTMTVEGEILTLEVHPEPGASYPILVDPVAEGFTWFNNHTSAGLGDWSAVDSASGAYRALSWTYWYSPGIPGLDLTSGFPGAVPAGSQANWNYYVPRYWQETPKPTSYITAMWLSDTVFFNNNNYEANPYFVQGLWDGTQEWWRSEQTFSGVSGERPNYELVYPFYNESPLDEHVKAAGIALIALEAEASAKYRTGYVGMATIALGDHDAPKWVGPGESSSWTNAGPASLHFKVGDSGLGVQRVTAKEVTGTGGTKALSPVQEVTLPCSGLAVSACPATYEPGVSGEPKFEVPTSGLEQGTDTLRLVATDPIGNQSEVGKVQVKVDHTAPELTVGGTITEQASLGTHLASYGINIKAKDGTTEHPQSGVASFEVKVNGTKIGGQAKGCTTSNCLVEEELSLVASQYPDGTYTLEVTAEDAVGLKAPPKQVIFQINHDTTEPSITTSGTLMSAPEGWVEQHSYAYSVSAGDAGGSGVKALNLRVDGKEVKGAAATCPKGACSLTVSGSLNMAAYAGGAHTAEIVATDAAGNVARKAWTLNVDPAGAVTTGEAVATMEATEETSEASLVASTEELISPEEREDGNDPGLRKEGSAFVSTGTPDTSVIEVGKEGGFQVEAPAATLEVEAKTPSAQSNSEVVNGVASTTSNEHTGVDTVTRPVYNGVMTFAQIREAGAQHNFEWTVELSGGQYLQQIDPQNVGFYFENGEEAFLITAEPAADAVGTTVPTTLTLSGKNVITLSVNLTAGGYVYPVQAGAGWEGGFITEGIIPPETQHELEERLARELREQWEREQQEAAPTPTELEGDGSEGSDESLSNQEPMTPSELKEISDSLNAGSGQHRNPNKPVPIKQARHILRKHIVRAAIPAPNISLIGGPGGNGSGGWEKEFHVGAETCSQVACGIWQVRYAPETTFKLVRTGSASGHQEYAAPAGGAHCGSNVDFWWSLNLEVEAISAGTRGPAVVNSGSGEHLTFWCKFHMKIFFLPDIDSPEVLEETSVLIDQVFSDGYQSVFTQHWNTWINEM